MTDGRQHKHLIYTRTSAAVLAMPSYGLKADADVETLAYSLSLLEALVCEPFICEQSGETLSISNIALCQLSHLSSQEALTGVVRNFLTGYGLHYKCALVFFVDMAETPTSRVNFCRHKIDEELRRFDERSKSGDPMPSKSVFLVLHSPAANIYVQSCYDTTFCGQWEVTFLDSLSEEAGALGALDISEWLKLGASTESMPLVDADAWDLMPALVGWLPSALMEAASRIDFPTGRSEDGFNPDRPLPLQARVKLLDKLLLTPLSQTGGLVTVQHVLCTRYSDLWKANDHCLIRDRVRTATQTLAAGQLRVSLVEAITGEVREVFTNYLSLMLFRMDEHLNLDVLDEEHVHPCVLDIFSSCLLLLPVPPVPELKLLSQARRITASSLPPYPSCMFPFFSHVAAIFDQATDEAAAAAAGVDEQELSAAVATKVLESDAPLASVAVRLLSKDLSDVLWSRYLAHFVSRLDSAPDSSMAQRMLCAWLGSHCHAVTAECKVAVLHVAARMHEALWKGLAGSLKGLAGLSGATALDSSIAAVVTDFRVDSADAQQLRLNHAMLAAFHTHMMRALESGDVQQLAHWVNAFGRTELRQLVLGGQGLSDPESAMILTVMSLVHAAAAGLEDGQLPAVGEFAQRHRCHR